MPLNSAWHAANPLPRNPSFEQRLAWHREHARECGCRQPPPDIAAALAAEAAEADRAPEPEPR